MKHFCSFSEAIREGAKLRPQLIGAGVNEALSQTCAYAAGCHAIVGSLATAALIRFSAYGLYPYLFESDSSCPAGCGRRPGMFENSLFNLIIHLNDVHQWGRNAIADWLESEEEKLGFVTVVEGESSRSQTEVSEVVMV